MKIIDVLNQDKINISCELFPPKQGAELQNALDIVNKIALMKPSYMSVTYGAGGTSVGHTVAIAKGVQDNGIPALAHLTCVKSSEENILEVLQQLKDNGISNVLALR
ncbi:MAG: methylenetetrahydrofolate reductase, partial [Phascolarctobacterium sp.]|nr:methylenetetrahydrofolate reductase [Phascolarctobacterium sp.]